MLTPLSNTTETPCGLRIFRESRAVDGAHEAAAIARALDRERGLLLRSSVQQPGRYARYDLGFHDPPFALSARGRRVRLQATRREGLPVLYAAREALREAPYLADMGPLQGGVFEVEIAPGEAVFDEANRTRRNSVLSVLRTLLSALSLDHDAHLGFYGAVGYDLVFQFEDLRTRMDRDGSDPLLSLFLPDRLLVVDHERGTALMHSYRFELPGLAVDEDFTPPQPEPAAVTNRPAGRPRGAVQPFEDLVGAAKAAFARGDLFEVTPSQTFSVPCTRRPSLLFERLCVQNPAPFGFLANLDEDDVLVGASPEMFVRVQGRRVETCPIAGTVARGRDAFQDAAQIRVLLQSSKDEDELTMCTDVDRNDKARVCEPGSVRVIARRQIEMYSRLIHTVDHVEGELSAEYDALDAFLTHCWAVTVTGAPKPAAMQFIEDHEHSPRGYYGGAVGVFGLDGHLNTGLVLRTMRLRGGQAEVRAGATLLHASVPLDERRETELKASALLAVLGRDPAPPIRVSPGRRCDKHVLLVDHRDSFVHTLSDYLRQAGARVTTLRAGFPLAELERLRPDLVVLSPGPGRPEDFATDSLLTRIAQLGLPTFGVCLGLQAMVLHAGGSLTYLDTPRHGNASELKVLQPRHPLFTGLPQQARVGRYHSMCADERTLPRSLQVLARAADDDRVMAIAHRTLPFCAVQFHPESLMSLDGGFGLGLINNVVQRLPGSSQTRALLSTR